ncbi:MAG: ABC transporter substrate-binding protein [Solirubrobacteraceae bacterium]
MRQRTRTLLVAALLGGALLLCGCGGSVLGGPQAGSLTSASLVLDFTPNPVHVGIYEALAHGYDTAAGVRLHVIVPSASTDAIKLLEAGRVNFAILDIHDLAIAREHGGNIVGVLPIVQRPLAAVIAQPQISSPRQLDGRLVGITGDPSDTAVLRSVVAGSGGNPAKVKTITIGFDAVSDLLAGRVAAATAFWSDEGVTLQARHPGFQIFRVDDYGAPSYPELVVCTTSTEIDKHPALVRAVVHALTRGYDAALADPAGAQETLESRVPGLDRQLVNQELAALLPAFTGPDGRFGVFDEARLRAWARWEKRFGIVARTPDVATTFDPRFAP